ncbi:Dyp-type peroxidase [Algicola sagamiensis]|uniref:Dyp-type peroxidase n=1 Tax=Algicola sagamiensis TaxID=163869 RepID=UPI00146DA1BD|nr:Dyp-type peroxidase [Algicola sagamiensis]
MKRKDYMAREQSGVCAGANLHGVYLLFNAVDGQEGLLRQKLAQFPALVEEVSDQFSESMLSSMIAIGANYWDILYPNARPPELAPFPVLESAGRSMPAVPYDIFIQIRSDRYDVNHLFGRRICQLLGQDVELVEQIIGFRYLDGRDLTGFIADNGKLMGQKRRKVALVNDSRSEFIGGSYIHMQRYCFHLQQWESLPMSHQEEIYGRSKLENELITAESLLRASHAYRFGMMDSDAPAEVLIESMPYGDMKQQGVMIVSCCASGDAYAKVLRSRVYGDGQGNYDHLLDFAQAESGAAFFAPSIAFLQKRGGMGN